MIAEQQQLMHSYIAKFPQHLQDALAIYHSSERASFNPKTILICGLGGSGIGGRIIADYLKGTSPIPIQTLNAYDLPAWVNEDTLVIGSSYSGNTEETVSVLTQAQNKTKQIAIITSGGKLKKMAEDNGIYHLVVPGGEQPRAMLGYSLVLLAGIMNDLGIWPRDFDDSWKAVSKLLNGKQPQIMAHAQIIASQLVGQYPILYADNKFEAILIRLRQQLNENAKVLCSHHVYPEMNHNELVGWAGVGENVTVLDFHSDRDHERNKIRMEFCQKAMNPAHHVKIQSMGSDLLEDCFYFVHLGDWISYYLAVERNVDPIEVNIIAKLKSTIAE